MHRNKEEPQKMYLEIARFLRPLQAAFVLQEPPSASLQKETSQVSLRSLEFAWKPSTVILNSTPFVGCSVANVTSAKFCCPEVA